MITGKDLLAWGWPGGPELGAALREAKKLEAEGLSADAIRSQLAPQLASITTFQERRAPDPSRLGVAAEADSAEAEETLNTVYSQMLGMTTIPVVERAAILPDACPTGGEKIAITVGGAIAVREAIIPAAHSADICCSMYCSVFPESDQPIKELLTTLRRHTRFGMGGRDPVDWIHHPVLEEKVWRNPFLNQLEHAAKAHLGDQGDGNHFAYLGRLELSLQEHQQWKEAGYGDLAVSLQPEKSYHVLVTHHGSRALGAQLYKRGLRAAKNQTKRLARDIPDSAAWISMETTEGQDYWDALQYVSRWTRANHEVIHQGFLNALGQQNPLAAFGNEHNFVWRRDDGLYYHGKGATPAWKDSRGRPLLGLIPLNMASPILLCLGADNDHLLGFAPHGAGRDRSRSALMRDYRTERGGKDTQRIHEAITQATSGIEVDWWYGQPDLTETPLGYKSPDTIIDQIERFQLGRICGRIQPLGCLMAGDPGPAPWKLRKNEPSPKELRQQAHRAERRRNRQMALNDPED